ncbi:thermonuclease family protein [Candidatus Gracilibacteria bacterium]|nr:thermonuclease family protein [Candidatus Gracilibacteria bacterium]
MKKRRIFLGKALTIGFFLFVSGASASSGDLFKSSYVYTPEADPGVIEKEISESHVFPETQIILQRPSYVVDEGNNIYRCENEYDECKVNFALQTLDRKHVSTKYSCHWKTSFESEQLVKCNPNTIIFPEGVFDITLEMTYDKTEGSKVVHKFQVIHENVSEPQIPDLTPNPSPERRGEQEEENNKIPADKGELRGVSDFEGIQIDGVLVNPKGSDVENEFIRIKNISQNTINLKGLFLDDVRDKGSKQYQIAEDIFLTPGQIHTFYKHTTGVSLGNTDDQVNIGVGDTIIDSISWDFQIPDDYVLKKGDTQYIERTATVVRVIDGDTLEVQLNDSTYSKLRLIGVDTPETNHPRKDPELYGKEALSFTRSQLLGKQIIIQQNLENYADTYDRLLGYVFIGDVFFNEEIIQKGWARAYTRYDFRYKQRFLKAEEKAKENKRGMWYKDEEFSQSSHIAPTPNPSPKGRGEEEDKFMEQEEEKESSQPSLLKGEHQDNNFPLDKGGLRGVLEVEFEEKKEVSKKSKRKKIPFQKTISYQKKSFKISGKTKAYTTVVVEWGGETHYIDSDEEGKYSHKFTELIPGEYDIDFYVLSDAGEREYIKSAPILLTQEYVENMKGYYTSVSIKESSQHHLGKEESEKENIGEQIYIPKSYPKDINEHIEENIIEFDSEDPSEEPKTPLGVVFGYILFGLSCLIGFHFEIMREMV